MRSSVRNAVVAGAVAALLSTPAFADPPPPPENPTICPTVQCMRVNSTVDNLDGTFTATFEAFNWFNTTADTGVNRVVYFPSSFKQKQCTNPGEGFPESLIQVDVVGAAAPAGWTVVQADNNKVEFATTSTANEIPELDLCAPAVTGGCINGGGPGVSTCGNSQGGFQITLRPDVATGDICSWAVNWRQLDEFGLDNGDVMNFGALAWTFGSLIEQYSNNPYPPALFELTSNVESCAKAGRGKATKYAQTRLKEFSKCLDKLAKNQFCDTAKRDLKVSKAQTKLEQAIDSQCLSDDDVANVAWCGTTIANVKTCLVAQMNSTTDATLDSIYGPH